MNLEDKIQKIKEILYWNDEMLCPRCGSKIEVEGSYGCGQWYPVNNNKYPFEHCSQCDFKHDIDLDDRLPDELYLDEIRKVVYDGER